MGKVFHESKRLDSQQKLLEEHLVYLERIAREGEISPELSQAAWDVLTSMMQNVGPDLEIPDAIAGVDGKLFYTWRRGDNYFELEMLPDGCGEFFYRNGKSGQTWSQDHCLKNPLPPEVITKLRMFERV